MIKVRQTINELLHKHTGQTIKKIEKDSDRNFFMGAKEAKDYGIIDKIITTRE
jgi:ATP-dependent Clp protease protease subunit